MSKHNRILRQIEAMKTRIIQRQAAKRGGVIVIDDGGDDQEFTRLADEFIASRPPDDRSGYLIVPRQLTDAEWRAKFCPQDRVQSPNAPAPDPQTPGTHTEAYT